MTTRSLCLSLEAGDSCVDARDQLTHVQRNPRLAWLGDHRMGERFKYQQQEERCVIPDAASFCHLFSGPGVNRKLRVSMDKTKI